MNKKMINTLVNSVSVLGLIVSIALIVVGYSKGWFQDSDSLRHVIKQAGSYGIILFIGIQIIQVVIPVIPGGITSVAGVILFGVYQGFLWDYVGIVIGSVMNFYLARTYGRRFVESVVSEKTFNKYIGWLDKGKRYEKFFLFAILFPCSPDDFLCQISGLTKMSFKKFLVIILFGKPVSIFLYSTVLANLMFSLPKIV